MTEQFIQDLDSDPEIQKMLQIIHSKQKEYKLHHTILEMTEKMLQESREARLRMLVTKLTTASLCVNKITIRPNETIQRSGIGEDVSSDPEK